MTLDEIFVVDNELEVRMPEVDADTEQAVSILGVSAGSNLDLVAMMYRRGMLEEEELYTGYRTQLTDALQSIYIRADNKQVLQQALCIGSSHVQENSEEISGAYAHFGLAPGASDELLMAKYAMVGLRPNAQDKRYLKQIADYRQSDILRKFLDTGSYKPKKRKMKKTQTARPAPSTVPGRSTVPSFPSQTTIPGVPVHQHPLVSPRGLVNHGHTCYFNCVLQYLFRVYDFRQRSFNARNNQEYLHLFGDTFREMDRRETGPVNYDVVLATQSLVPGAGTVNEAQDVAECLERVFDLAAAEIPQEQRDTFRDYYLILRLSAYRSGSLQDKITEALEGRQLIVVSPILNFSVDRVHRHPVTNEWTVSEVVIPSPREINMNAYYVDDIRGQNLNYTLHAIFYHAGAHYWAYILDHTTNQWWLYNDRVVQPATEADALSCPNARALLYSYVQTEIIHQLVTPAIP
ncbi:hypothetical protein FB192DRAFT_1349000 [Mucor lusitanicus]|nr:hypothetical protein FB192DRAFT_1349000 [Mucor lusitanicus]